MSSFSDVKSAVDAVVEILQSGIPMARIGRLIVFIVIIEYLNKSIDNLFFFIKK